MDLADIKIGAGHIWAAGIIWPVVCTAAVSLRFLIRRTQKIRYGWDDYLLVPALIMLYGIAGAALWAAHEKHIGYPSTIWQGPAANISNRHKLKTYFSIMAVQAPTLACLKVSCLIFYRRIFRTGTNKITDRTLVSLIAIMAAWGIAFLFNNIFMCGSTDVSIGWSADLVEARRCSVHATPAQQAFVVSDVVTDAILFLFPLPFLWKLHMSLLRKLGLTVIFILGSASLGMSAVRMEILYQSSAASRARRAGIKVDIDAEYITTAMVYFSLLETGFGLCAICLPALAGGFKLGGLTTFFQNLSRTFSERSSSITSNLQRKRSQDSAENTASENASHLQSRGEEHVTHEVKVTREEV